MTLWSTLFPGRKLLSRHFYNAAGTFTVTAPAGGAFMRTGMVGGGAFNFGAAFAFYKGAATPAETFTLVVGARAAALGADAGDTSLTRDTGAVLLAKAMGALHTAIGTAAGSTGTTKRDGVAGAYDGSIGGYVGGASGTDDADTHALGMGGPGAWLPFEGRAPGAGGGGLHLITFYNDGAGYVLQYDIDPGHGRAYVEFYNVDPGF